MPEGSPELPVAVRARRLRTLALSVILLVFVAVVLERGGLPLLPDRDALRRSDAGGVTVFALLLGVHLVVRYARHHFLLEPVAHVPLARLVRVNAIGMAFITFLPFRLGEVVRPALLSERGRLSVWAVAATISAERLLDGVFYSGLLLVGLALAPPDPSASGEALGIAISARVLPHLARLVSLAFLGAFAVLAAFRFYRAPARRMTETILGALSPRLAKRAGDLAEQLTDGLRFLERPKRGLPYLAVTAFAIAAHVVALQCLARAVGLGPLGFAQASVVLGVLALGFALPNAPGFFGAVQVALYAGLALYVPPAGVVREGAVFVFAFYSAYVGEVLALAGVSLLVEWARGRRGA